MKRILGIISTAVFVFSVVVTSSHSILPIVSKIAINHYKGV